MASIGSACRLSARAAGRQLRSQTSSRRGFRTAAVNYGAHNFTMPAMSPTMTEGNIATWKVKEGDSFSTGDVILEIETDKAQMDVEAQDDGILFKIIQGDGSKSVQVGTRIAVLADPDDDISSLEIPADESTTSQSKSSEKTSEPPTSGSSAPQPTSEPASRDSKPAKSKSGGTPTKQTYPLYPAVLFLLKENGLSKADADKIPATGPNGRLLKGDVLAYLGKIEPDYSAQQSKRITKLGHLDLSNIKVAQPAEKAPKKDAKPAAVPEPEPEPDTEIALPISLSAVLKCQKRIQETLGTHLPLSTFVARAVELANEELPRGKNAPATADELFNAVLGLDKTGAPKTSRGVFMPEITPLAPELLAPTRQSGSSKKVIDAIDILTGTAKTKTSGPVAIPISAKPVKGDVNVFSVVAAKGEEKRAMVFLERVKTVLEVEPGRLVL